MILIVISILNILTLTYVFARSSRKEFTAFSYYYILVALYYIFPSFYFSLKEYFGIPYDSFYLTSVDQQSWILASIVIFIFTLITFIIQNLKVIDILCNEIIDILSTISVPRQLVRISVFALSIFVLVSSYFYSQAFGSYKEMYENSALVRSLSGNDIALNPELLIFSRFAYMAIVPFALLIAVVRFKQISKTAIDILFLILALVMLAQHLAMSVFGSLSKQSALDPLIIILIGYGYLKSKNVSYLVLAAFFSGIFLVPLIEPFTVYSWTVNRQYEVFYDLDAVINNFTHAFSSLTLVLNENSDNYSIQLFINDYIGGLGGNVIPSSWVLNLLNNDSVYVNSYLRFGIQQLAIPPGGVAASFGYFGIISFFVISSFFAIFVKCIDVLRTKLLLSSIQNSILAAVLITLINPVIYHGLPKYYLYTPSLIICIFMSFILVTKK